MHPVYRSFAMFVACGVPTAALAGPNDVTLSGMAEHHGVPVTTPLTDEYLSLVRDLAAVVGTRPAGPARTSGWHGVAVGLDAPTAFLPSDDTTPTGWERANAAEKHQRLLATPQLSVRKGLPFSTELGVRGGVLSGTSQGVVGVEVRGGLVEDQHPWPDVTLHAGTSWYLGNPELDLRVNTTGATLGWTLPFATAGGPTLPKLRDAACSPWLDFRLLRTTATANVDLPALGLVPVRPSVGDDPTARPVNRAQLGAGLQITHGNYDFRVYTAFTGVRDDAALLTVGAGAGASF